MSDVTWLGIAIITVSAIFNGIFAIPMKYFQTWRFENMWLFYSVLSRAVFALLAIVFVPNLWIVYSSTPIHILLIPLGLGLLLGVAQVTNGVGIAVVGTSVAMAVVSGVSCTSGALIPILVLHPGGIFHPQGILLLISLPILLLGLVFYSIAGRRRENEQVAPRGLTIPWGFVTGLTICIVTGILGSSINLGFAFSGEIMRESIKHGGNAINSTYAVWALLFAASLIPNVIYSAYLLSRNHTWTLFLEPKWGKDVMLSTLMMVLSTAAFVGYGIGATMVGEYGTSLGWATFVGATIIAATLAGLWTDEWKNSALTTRKMLFWAVVVILASVAVSDLGGLF